MNKTKKRYRFKKFIPFFKEDGKSVVMGIVYEPDVIDAQGDFASAEEIEKASHRFMKSFRQINVQHTKKIFPDLIPVESYTAPNDMKLGKEPVKKGSWMLGVDVGNLAVKDEIEKGGLNGYSMEGSANRVESGGSFEMRDIIPDKVSFVDRAANMRNVLIFKSEDGTGIEDNDNNIEIDEDRKKELEQMNDLIGTVGRSFCDLNSHFENVFEKVKEVRNVEST